MTSVDVVLWSVWQAAWLVLVEGDASRFRELKFDKMKAALGLLCFIHRDNLESASFLATWACILDQSSRDLQGTIDSLPTVETFLKYDPNAVCSTMDKIHDLFFDKAVSYIREHTINCTESCDLLSELMMLVQDQDKVACN